MTSAGAGTEEDDVRVKGSIQRWLNYVCANDVLMRDDEMIFFVESDFGYSPVIRMKQPATGVRRKMLKQFAPPPDDTPELHEARPLVKRFYLGTMDTGQKVDRVVKSRRGQCATISLMLFLTQPSSWSRRVRSGGQTFSNACSRDPSWIEQRVPQARKDYSDYRGLSCCTRHC